MNVCFNDLTGRLAIVLITMVIYCEESLGIRKPKYIISTVIVEPYTMSYAHNQSSYSKECYYGFIPDMISRLSGMLNFDYQFLPAPDNQYGSRRADGTWDGMIGQLMKQESDIAAGPLLGTKPRMRAVNFTRPFLKTQATILLRRPPPGQQLNIKTARDLVYQSEIQYGTLKYGLIKRAFLSTNDTAYRLLWRRMLAKPSVFTESNLEGIQRVRSEKYGYIIPHTIGDYIVRRKPCDLTTIDRFLMDGGYSLAVSKGSKKLHRALDTAIATMISDGYIESLYKKWWIYLSECNGATVSKRDSASSCRPAFNTVLLLLPMLLASTAYIT